MRKPLASGILAHLADSHVQILVIRLIAHGMDSLNRTNRGSRQPCGAVRLSHAVLLDV